MSPDDVQAIVDAPRTVTREAVAQAYARMLRVENWTRDVSHLNHAIIQRWSISGLTWIKRRAWKLYETASPDALRDRIE